MRPFIIVVAAALIDTQSRVLLAQRPEGKKMAGLWEFPGGKLDDGETLETALVRELHEELGITVDAKDLEPVGSAAYPYEDFHLLMPLYACRVWKGEPQSREGQKLAWVTKDELANYEMPPADVPLVETLRPFLWKS